MNDKPRNLEMCCDIRFNHNLTKSDYICPGGYEMKFKDKNVQFDFMDYIGNIDNNDSRILHCEMEIPDFDSFPEFENITIDDINNINEIIDFYVYIGEESNPEVEFANIIAITFWMDNHDPINVNEEVINKYNQSIN